MKNVSKRPVRRPKRARWLYRIALGLLMAVVLTCGAGVGYIYFGSTTVRRMMHEWRTGMWRPEKAFPGRQELTLLVLGRDVDRDGKGRIVNTNGRTDTIILARLDFAHHTANMLSIPRDTLVRIPGYRGKHKINAAHAIGGPELTLETVESLLNVRPDEYIAVDYESFEEAIDMLGGLEITVARQMDYDDSWGGLHIHLKPGTQVLDGRQALGFVRYRKSNDGIADTDQERIARQQQFLMAGRNRILAPSAFLRLPRVIETVRTGVKSSMSDAQMMAVARFMRGLPPDAVGMVTLPGETERSYVKADKDEAKKLINEMFKS